MKLFLNNIGKIKDTTINLRGLTVITGQPGSGKSTIIHSLMCLCADITIEQFLCGFDNQIQNVKHNKRDFKLRLDTPDGYLEYGICPSIVVKNTTLKEHVFANTIRLGEDVVSIRNLIDILGVGYYLTNKDNKQRKRLEGLFPIDKKVSNIKGEYFLGKLNINKLSLEERLYLFLRTAINKNYVSDTTLFLLDGTLDSLHPRAQNLLTQIIVLMIKYLGCKVIITTNAGNVLAGLEAYYMQQKDVKGDFYHGTIKKPFSTFECVNNSRKAYEDFMEPFLDLEPLLGLEPI